MIGLFKVLKKYNWIELTLRKKYIILLIFCVFLWLFFTIFIFYNFWGSDKLGSIDFIGQVGNAYNIVNSFFIVFGCSIALLEYLTNSTKTKNESKKEAERKQENHEFRKQQIRSEIISTLRELYEVDIHENKDKEKLDLIKSISKITLSHLIEYSLEILNQAVQSSNETLSSYAREVLEDNKATLNNKNLRKLDLNYLEFKKAIFENSDLTDTYLKNSYLIECNFNGINGYNVKFNTDNSTIKKRITELNKNFFIGANLEKSSFAGAHITEVKFNNACLKEANFEDATLNNVDFTGAKLQSASFKCCVLINVNFNKADTTDLDLSRIIKFENPLNLTKKQIIEAKTVYRTDKGCLKNIDNQEVLECIKKRAQDDRNAY